MKKMNEQREKIEQQLIEKAMKDAGFRQQLLENTRETLEKELGFKLPDSVKINVLEESPEQFYLVIPGVVEDSAFGELSEEELKTVSGGGAKLYTTAPQYCNPWNHGS